MRSRQCRHRPPGRVRGHPGNRHRGAVRLRLGTRDRTDGRRAGGGAGGGGRRCVPGRRTADLRSDEGRRAHRIVEGVRQGADGEIRHTHGRVPGLHRLCRCPRLRGRTSVSRRAEVRRTGRRQGRGHRGYDGGGRRGLARHVARRQVRRGQGGRRGLSGRPGVFVHVLRFGPPRVAHGAGAGPQTGLRRRRRTQHGRHGG